MKVKELEFARRLLVKCGGNPNVANVAFDDSDDKQLMYYLEKWTRKDWWEYGVSLRTGWFTEKGVENFKKMTNQTKESKEGI